LLNKGLASGRGLPVEPFRMSPEPESKDTRERLVAAAAELFWRQGYAATGVAQILREAGARSGSLYYFFPTKEDLLMAVLERYKTLLWPMVVGPVFEHEDDPIERVFGILGAYKRMLLEFEFRKGCPIGNLALELSDSHPNVRRLIDENFDLWRGHVRDSLEAAADRFSGGVDADSLSAFVLTVMEGAVMQARARQSTEQFDASVGHLRAYLNTLMEGAAAMPAAARRPAVPKGRKR